MRLQWKLIVTCLASAVICVSACTCAVLHASFSALLEREAENTRQNGEYLLDAMKRRFADSGIGFLPDPEKAADLFESRPRSFIPEAFSDPASNGLFFTVLDTSGEALYSDLPEALSPEPHPDGQAMWRIRQSEGRMFLCVSLPVRIGDRRYSLEIVRDESAVFAERNRQLLYTLSFSAAALALTFPAVWLVLHLSLRRITLLTHAAKRLANGDLSVRAEESGTDELAALSANINRMTQRLSEQMEELRAEAERKELFVGAFSHELKTPMTSIIGYADLLLRRDLTREQQHLCLNYIFTEGKRLESMSMRLLDLIVLGKQEIYKKPVSLRLLVKDVVTLIMPKLNEAGIRLVYNVSPGEIEMEQELMKTVFINLIDNACNAMDSGGEIRLLGKWSGSAYLLSVQDNGKGMDPSVLSHITDAFYMADKSRSRQHGGAGLGLAICSEILHLHGFSIRFESTEGIGTLAEVVMEGGAG